MTFRSTGQSTGLAVIFLTVVPPVDRPVDRTKPVVRLPGRPAVPKSKVLSVGRPPGRPAYQAGHVHVFMHIGRPVRSTTSRPVDRQQDLAEIKGMKTWSF